MNCTDVSDMRRPTASIRVLMVDKPLKRRYTSTRLHGALMMEAVSFSETTVYFKEITRRCITVKVKQSLYTPWRRLGGEKI
jgi:hypothetical protein